MSGPVVISSSRALCARLELVEGTRRGIKQHDLGARRASAIRRHGQFDEQKRRENECCTRFLSVAGARRPFGDQRIADNRGVLMLLHFSMTLALFRNSF